MSAAPLDWLPDAVTMCCQTVVEIYGKVISKVHKNIVLDGVRRASNRVKTQTCTLATLFVPAIQDFLLPELKDAWRSAHSECERLIEDVGNSHSISRVDEAVLEIKTTILIFEYLAKGVVNHCRILGQSDWDM
jgi:hypothetical protein